MHQVLSNHDGAIGGGEDGGRWNAFYHTWLHILHPSWEDGAHISIYECCRWFAIGANVGVVEKEMRMK